MRPIRVLNYYGSKVLAAKLYPRPTHSKIIEPFAGGAGYSLAHRNLAVEIYDLNPDVIGAWQYIIETPGSEILRLPLLKIGESVPLELPTGARLLIGWSTMMCGARPQRMLVPAAARVPSSFWGESKRRNIALIADEIKHWRATVAEYNSVPSTEATWFIDPPYQGKAGAHYTHNSSAIDYAHLATWVRSRPGQVIVCEGPEASWLPFRPHHEHSSAPTSDVSGRRISREAIWTNE